MLPFYATALIAVIAFVTGFVLAMVMTFTLSWTARFTLSWANQPEQGPPGPPPHCTREEGHEGPCNGFPRRQCDLYEEP